VKKEKVYIIVMHKHTVKSGTDDWAVNESVEFVNQLREKHLTMSTAIGDYINRKMISGSRYGMSDYNKFEVYLRKKYESQMDELDTAYKHLAVAPVVDIEEITDEFGNIREKTVFD
jgi:hypothetical protein